MTDDRIHANATKAMNTWHAALTDYRVATNALAALEADLRAVRREMKDMLVLLVASQRKRQVGLAFGVVLAAHLPVDEQERLELLLREAVLEREVANNQRDISVAQETMKLNAAVLRYATEERHENAERIALEGRTE